MSCLLLQGHAGLLQTVAHWVAAVGAAWQELGPVEIGDWQREQLEDPLLQQ